MCSKKLIQKIFALGALVFALCASADAPMCPLNFPSGPIVAYEDRFSDGWSSGGSWGVTITNPAVITGQNGSSAVKVDFSGSWTGVEFHRSNLTTGGRNMLAFRISKETAAGDIFVGVHKVSPDAVESYVRASSYLVPNQSTPFIAGQWYSVLIPLSDLGAEGVPINGIVFQDEFAGVVYFEDVFLVNMPSFKLPLPGNKSWLLTVEAGGKAFDGIDDTNHYEKKAYFSIDFDDISQQIGQETDVKVLASAGGKVFFASTTEGDAKNGYYVVIDHDGDGNIKTGYSTWYAHMKQGSILVSTGNTVTQGQQLGIVGNTGDSGGTHLHFGFKYNGKNWLKKSDGTIDEEAAMFLRMVKIEGRKIEEYKITGPGSVPTGYYLSTNLQ
jgi:hypothetical protein